MRVSFRLIALARRKPKDTHLVDEVVPLAEVVAEMRALAPALEISSASGRSDSA